MKSIADSIAETPAKQDGCAVFAARTGSVSIYALADVLLTEGAPLDHVEISERMGVPKHRVCRLLAHLEKSGRVLCLRRSQRGGGKVPGVWNLTEAGHAWALEWCRRPICSQCGATFQAAVEACYDAACPMKTLNNH